MSVLQTEHQTLDERLASLIKLSQEIGREDRKLSILAEGNTSSRTGSGQFAVKASGSCLGTLTRADLTICESGTLLAMLDAGVLTDTEIESRLMASRVAGLGRRPSCEAVFHSWLLGLEGVEFVGHCHPTAANQILCSPRARDFAERRIFPDEVVCCGPASVLVPYVDPGLPLAREIRDRTLAHIQLHAQAPRLILLQNHGIIALGATPAAVLTCLLMAAKAAEIFVGAAILGGPVFMPLQEIQRIGARPDEAYRQRALGL